MKEQSVMSKLKEAELLASITEYKNKIAELERKHCEKWTQEEINKNNLNDRNFDDNDIMVREVVFFSLSVSQFISVLIIV